MAIQSIAWYLLGALTGAAFMFCWPRANDPEIPWIVGALVSSTLLILAIVAGAGLAVLGSLFAVRGSTWWKVYLLAILLVVGTFVGIGLYVQPA